MTIYCTAFADGHRLASGPLPEVALQVKACVDTAPEATVLIFGDADSQLIELDLRGSAADVASRLPHDAPAAAPLARAADAAGVPAQDTVRGPGRPKLGVVAREVTLLPRHWDWLAHQPGGASVALRKLVDQARHANESKERALRAQEVTYRFMSAIGGDQPQFEEAARALFAFDPRRFEQALAAWPHDLREHALHLAQAVFAGSGE